MLYPSPGSQSQHYGYIEDHFGYADEAEEFAEFHDNFAAYVVQSLFLFLLIPPLHLSSLLPIVLLNDTKLIVGPPRSDPDSSARDLYGRPVIRNARPTRDPYPGTIPPEGFYATEYGNTVPYVIKEKKPKRRQGR